MQPSLFGLSNSNRDFSLEESWGKNQFNSSFPAALCCYMASRNIASNYICFKDSKRIISELPINNLLGINTAYPFSDDICFSFESAYSPYASKILGNLPRTDLVIQNKNILLRALEIKLTALPDNTTCSLDEDIYGSEIVVRPDTIIYLACSLAESIEHLQIPKIKLIELDDWEEPSSVIPHLQEINEILRATLYSIENEQIPFLLQPIWKTNGKKAELSDNCLDVFAWSNIAFSHFILDIAVIRPRGISRQVRTMIWLYKMLSDMVHYKKCNTSQVIDRLAYNSKNDKAFASSGRVTQPYMACERLINPIIKKEEIKNIILGGGQNLLSPERRFDAIIVNTPDLFEVN